MDTPLDRTQEFLRAAEAGNVENIKTLLAAATQEDNKNILYSWGYFVLSWAVSYPPSLTPLLNFIQSHSQTFQMIHADHDYAFSGADA